MNGRCRICGADTGSKTRGYCCEQHRIQGMRKHDCVRRGKRELTPAQVDQLLCDAVDREHAPPWVRHPIPQTGVCAR